MDRDKGRLRAKRRRNWRELIEKSPIKLPDTSEFEVDGDGKHRVDPSTTFLRCSQRELEWLYEKPAADVLSDATAITEVVARFEPSGIEQPFLPSIMRVNHVGRIYLTKGEAGDDYRRYVSYQDGTARFGPAVIVSAV